MNVSTNDWLEQVICEAQTGRESALRLLYLKYAPRLYGYLFYVLEDVERDAEPTIHAILREAVRSSARGTSFGTWLHRAAYLRVAQPPAPCVPGRVPRRDYQLVTLSLSPAASAFGLDVQSLRAALRGLADAERHVAVLRLVQRLSTAETAWVMDCAEDEVARLQTRALVRLKALLGACESAGRN